MPIALTPTKIKQSLYLLIPKSIVGLVDLKDDDRLTLSVKKVKKKYILEYCIETNKEQE